MPTPSPLGGPDSKKIGLNFIAAIFATSTQRSVCFVAQLDEMSAIHIQQHLISNEYHRVMRYTQGEVYA